MKNQTMNTNCTERNKNLTIRMMKQIYVTFESND